MLIHCKIRRVGPTTVTLENTKYIFMPVPGTKHHTEILKNRDPKTKQIVETKREVYDESTSMCDINTDRHVEHLLQLGMYEEYNEEKVAAEQAEAEKPSIMDGFAVEKFLDKGYVAVNKKKKPYLYHGEAGDWVAKNSIASPFKSEIEVFTFLKDEAENPTEDEETSEVENIVDKLATKKKG